MFVSLNCKSILVILPSYGHMMFDLHQGHRGQGQNNVKKSLLLSVECLLLLNSDITGGYLQ